MLIFPAIDLYNKEAVRLYKGDYEQKTVYSSNPIEIARDFKACGAAQMHMVDLEGAKVGLTPNFDVICSIKQETGLFCEVGGGIRSLDTAAAYLNEGIDRVIFGTKAVTDKGFVREAVAEFNNKVAVGIDIKDNEVAVKGWLEKSGINAFDFCSFMCEEGVSTIIVTDISRDGAMMGTNRGLYLETSRRFPELKLIASGGVSSMEDVAALKEMNIYGAIIGKAYYTKAIDLASAVKAAE